MPKLTEITTEFKNSPVGNWIHAVVFGKPKTGKTELVGELAEHGFNLHWVDLEAGSKTLINSVSPEAQERIMIYKIPDTREAPMAVETCLKVIRPGSYLICHKHGKIGLPKCPLCAKDLKAGYDALDNTKFGMKDILVFDSITQLSASIMAHIGTGKDDTWKPDWDDWNREGNILDTFLGKVQNAPFHVICISHENAVKINDKESLVPTAGTRNFSRNSAKYFDEVVYTNIRNLRHEAASSTTYSNSIVTGSRSRTKLEDQKEVDVKTKESHISLLPIFQANGITGNEKATAILQQIKTGLDQK